MSEVFSFFRPNLTKVMTPPLSWSCWDLRISFFIGSIDWAVTGNYAVGTSVFTNTVTSTVIRTFPRVISAAIAFALSVSFSPANISPYLHKRSSRALFTFSQW